MGLPDTPSLAAGLYAGVIGYGVGIGLGIGGDPLLAGCTLIALAVAIAVGNRPALWVALGRRHLLSVPLVVPLSLAVGLIATVESGLLPDVSDTMIVWGLGVILAGFGFWLAGLTAYSTFAAGDSRASWTASPDRARYRTQVILSALGAISTVLGIIAVLLSDVPLPSYVFSGTIAFTLSMWIVAGRTREYEACERGLRYGEQGAIGRRFVPWTKFDSVRETDNAVVLERRWWLDERMAADEVPATAREALRTAIEGSSDRSQRPVRSR